MGWADHLASWLGLPMRDTSSAPPSQLRARFLAGAAHPPPLVAAHRAGAGEAPENTIAAVDRAAGAAHLLQMDVLLTKDGVPVVFHDASLLRATGVDAKVADTSLADLPQLRDELEVPFLPPEGAAPLHASAHGPGGCKIATLDELLTKLKTLPKTWLLLELWADDQRLVDAVAQAVEGFDRLIIGSPFSKFIFDAIGEALPEVPRILTIKDAIKLRVAQAFGILDKVGVPPNSVLNVPLVTREWRDKTPLPANVLRRVFVYLALRVLENLALGNRPLFMELQARGVPVFVWILNSPSAWETAIAELRPDAIQTDYPAELARYLETAR